YTGVAPLQKQHGQSLRPLIENPRATRDFAYNEWELLPARTGVPLSLRTVRTKAYKLTIDEQSGVGEMYDRANDPNEMTNIFDNPNAAVARKELLDMIAARPDDARPPQTPVGQA
ncbi:sulfatase, partial [Candidatus Entotheonella serta]